MLHRLKKHNITSLALWQSFKMIISRYWDIIFIIIIVNDLVCEYCFKFMPWKRDLGEWECRLLIHLCVCVMREWMLFYIELCVCARWKQYDFSQLTVQYSTENKCPSQIWGSAEQYAKSRVTFSELAQGYCNLEQTLNNSTKLYFSLE